MTKELKISKDRLYVSVYEKDDEAYDIWHKKIKIDKKRVYRFGKEDNFWAMGETGPCGPCSEIYYDQGAQVGCRKPNCQVGCPQECDRYIELWNLVFMQYERFQDGSLKPLPKPSVDTGMGLERVAAVMQGVSSNYDIDLFKSLIHVIEKQVDHAYGKGEDNDISIRVIADHIRSMSFLISEGVLPSNEGRGYVLRRIIRRAVRYGKKLGQHNAFLYKLVAPLTELMGETYPQLKEQKSLIEKVIFTEEERFLETLDRGMRLFEEEIASLSRRVGEKQKKVLPGGVVYKLYDTFGFPLDLIKMLAQEKKLSIDEKDFEQQMNEQRERARAKWKGFGEKQNPMYQELSKKIKTEFKGYELSQSRGKLKVIIKGGKTLNSVSAVKDGQHLELVFDATPFYGEGGGQIGDTGIIQSQDQKTVIEISDTQKPFPHFIVHRGTLVKGVVTVGEVFELIVNGKRRHDIMLNHTATHMLHYALQAQLGDHVRQAGSLVAPDRLRFDFTHFSPLTSMEIQGLENWMNERIRANDPVAATEMSYQEAIDIGAIALFGEKYEDKVRVLQIGDYSTELCGGTHLHGTGEIRIFKLISETAVSAGVRRIEALTGDGALKYLLRRDDALKEIEMDLKATSDNSVQKVRQLIARTKELERQQGKLEDRSIFEQAKGLMNKVREKNGVKILATLLPISDVKILRTYCDVLRNQMKSGIVVVGCNLGDRAVILAAVTKDLSSTYSAHDIVQKLSPIIGGKGGGKSEFAQGGGPDTQKLSEAIEKAYEL